MVTSFMHSIDTKLNSRVKELTRTLALIPYRIQETLKAESVYMRLRLSEVLLAEVRD
jgi:hypothetical protein